MPGFLDARLEALREAGIYRQLPGTVKGIDFWSNDYLGFARTRASQEATLPDGAATGSRLISGDRDEWQSIERSVAAYHGFPAALVFNSGYTALLGLLATLLKRTDRVIYDELSHACCRDGIRLGFAGSVRFSHNDALHLRTRLKKGRACGETFVVIEGRFSMDGDLAPLREIAAICAEYDAHLIVDEAHSGGIEGPGGAGLVAELGLQRQVFANVITYGKAFGAHGAAVLGSTELKEYLVNRARPFIYTTGMAGAQWAGIRRAYDLLKSRHAAARRQLDDVIEYYRKQVAGNGMAEVASILEGPIQTIRVPGNEAVIALENHCREEGLLVKGIRSPTVPAGRERLRVCLHAFNTPAEVDLLVGALRKTIG